MLKSLHSVLQGDDAVDGDVEVDTDEDEEYDSDEKEKMRELVSNKLKKDKGGEKTAEEEREKKSSRRYDRSVFNKLFGR